eukprot:15090060-Heterocapsa_arctica.AAC.1
MQSKGQHARKLLKAKAKLYNLPCERQLTKEVEESKKKQSTRLNRFKVFLPLPAAVDLNNLLAHKAKGRFDGKQPIAKSPCNLMKHREREDLNKPDNFWQEQA